MTGSPQQEYARMCKNDGQKASMQNAEAACRLHASQSRHTKDELLPQIKLCGKVLLELLTKLLLSWVIGCPYRCLHRLETPQRVLQVNRFPQVW